MVSQLGASRRVKWSNPATGRARKLLRLLKTSAKSVGNKTDTRASHKLPTLACIPDNLSASGELHRTGPKLELAHPALGSRLINVNRRQYRCIVPNRRLLHTAPADTIPKKNYSRRQIPVIAFAAAIRRYGFVTRPGSARFQVVQRTYFTASNTPLAVFKSSAE